MLQDKPSRTSVFSLPATQRAYLGGGLVLHPVDAGEPALPDQRVDADCVRTHLGLKTQCMGFERCGMCHVSMRPQYMTAFYGGTADSCIAVTTLTSSCNRSAITEE